MDYIQRNTKIIQSLQVLQLNYSLLMKTHKAAKVFAVPKSSKNRVNQQNNQLYSPHKEHPEQLWRELKIKVAAKQFSRHTRIRLQAWLYRLHRPQINKIWQQNRYLYLKLLNLMIDCEYICFPFLNFPPKDTLQIIQKHQTAQIIAEIQKAVKLNRVQSRKHSHLVDLQKTPSQSNQKDNQSPHLKSRRKVSVSNDSVRTLSVSQEIRKQLKKNLIGKSNQKVQPKFIPTTASFKIHVNRLDCSFQTSKFGQPEDCYADKLQKRSKKSSSLITEALNKENDSNLISQQLKKYTDSLSLKPHSTNKLNSLFPLKKRKKQVFFKRSPRFNVSNNWSERGELNEKLFTQRKYWQSNSLAEVGTPRYLNFYPSQPYPSLALSSSEQQQGMNTTRSKQNYCSNCLFKIWPCS